MKNIYVISLLSLFTINKAFAHSGSYVHMEKGKYELGLSYEITIKFSSETNQKTDKFLFTIY